MKTHTKHQIIEDEKGNPLFVVVPYAEYLDFLSHDEDENITIPNDVVESMVMSNLSPIQAWRNHKKFTQKEVAEKMCISQAAYSQMEKPEANLRKDTIQKIADALGVRFEQLHGLG